MRDLLDPMINGKKLMLFVIFKKDAKTHGQNGYTNNWAITVLWSPSNSAYFLPRPKRMQKRMDKMDAQTTGRPRDPPAHTHRPTLMSPHPQAHTHRPTPPDTQPETHRPTHAATGPHPQIHARIPTSARARAAAQGAEDTQRCQTDQRGTGSTTK
jgi:hypothetical protein